jgi:hypothetical protein
MLELTSSLEKSYTLVPNWKPEIAMTIDAKYDRNALTFDQLDEILQYDPLTGKIWWKIKTAKKVMIGQEAGCSKATKSGPNAPKYRYIRVFGKTMPAARVAWILYHGEWPLGKIMFNDGDSLNLKIDNLRMSNSLFSEHDYKTAEGRADYQREHRATYSMDRKDSDLRSIFGITLAEYSLMLIEQDGKCATCRQSETATRNGKLKALCVDHDHKTGKVRGLLCSECNQGLGKLKENRDTLLNMIAYLDKHAGRETVVSPTIVPAHPSEELH